MHRVLKEMLATKIVDFPNWLHLLALCEFLINTAINKFGVSPAMLVYREQPVLPQLFFKDLLFVEPAVPIGMGFLFKVSHTITNLKRQFFKVNQRISPMAPDREPGVIDYAICYVRLPRKKRSLARATRAQH